MPTAVMHIGSAHPAAPTQDRDPGEVNLIVAHDRKGKTASSDYGIEV
jgi:hypothetical protein